MKNEKEKEKETKFTSCNLDSKVMMMFIFVQTIPLNTFSTLNSACTSRMFLFPTIFALRYSWIHIGFMNCSNVTSNIEAMIDKFSCFFTVLNVPNIKPYDGHVQFGGDLDNSWPRHDHNIIEYVIILNYILNIVS